MIDSKAIAAGRMHRRMLIGLVGAAAAVVLALLGYQIWSAHTEALDEAATRTRNIAATIEARLDATLRRTEAILAAAADETPAEAMSPQAVPRFAQLITADLDRDLVNFGELAGLRVFAADGEPLYSSSVEWEPRANIADRPHFRRLRDDPQAGIVFSEVIHFAVTDRRIVVAGRALRDDRDRFLGVVLAVIDLSHYQRLFESLDVGPSGMIAIRRSNDFRGVVRRPLLAREINQPLPPGNPLREAMQSGRRGGTLVYTATSDGVRRTFSWRSVERYPFFVQVGAAHADVLAGWRTRSLAVGAAGALLLVLIGGLLARLWRMEASEARTVAELAAAEERLRLAITASQQGLYDLDLRSGRAVVNDEYARMLGYEPGQLAETHDAWVQRLHRDDRERAVLAFDDYIAGRRPDYSVEFRQQLPDGSYRWIHSIGRIVERDGGGQPLRMLGIHRDITDRRNTDDELIRLNAELESRVEQRTADLVAARDEAERANRAKSDFLSSMSHELRTPMNAILGFGQLLDSDPAQRLPAKQQRFVHEILRAGNHLLELIDDLLDLARIEAGKDDVAIESVQVPGLVRACLALVETEAREHGIDLSGAWLADCDCAVAADPVRLKQVLLNLLSNAVKYNRPGGRVDVRCEPQGGSMLLSVVDTGPGLSDEQQRRLFQSFERLDAARSGVKGAGIGLVLSKRLVEMMGGEIGLHSTPGVGSTFWVRLPRAVGTSPAAVPVAGPPAAVRGQPAGTGSPRTVLYIEDDPVNMTVMQAIFATAPGLRLIGAALPLAGLERALAERPDLILLDIQLPGMDGYEVLRRLRAHEATRAIPVIAVSANAMAADRQRGLAAGFLDYLTKPLDVDGLLATVSRALDGTPR